MKDLFSGQYPVYIGYGAGRILLPVQGAPELTTSDVALSYIADITLDAYPELLVSPSLAILAGTATIEYLGGLSNTNVTLTQLSSTVTYPSTGIARIERNFRIPSNSSFYTPMTGNNRAFGLSPPRFDSSFRTKILSLGVTYAGEPNAS